MVIPLVFVGTMNYFSVDVQVEDENGEQKTITAPNPPIFWSFVVYIIFIVIYGFMRNQSTRKEIMMKLYEERSRERGEETEPLQVHRYLRRHNQDVIRAHCCWSFCYSHDHDYVDDTTGMIHRTAREDQEEEHDEDFCTRLWDCLSKAFWCCGCWCQCCGLCALAQEEREVNRITGNVEHKIDYLTFQPYSEYYPSIQTLKDSQIRSAWKHVSTISDLSSKLLKNVAVVLLTLLLFALSDINASFTWENMIVLLLTLFQAFFIEYLVHWRWNLFDLSFDSVVKYFACGFLLTTPMAIVFEMVVSTLSGIVVFVIATIVIASDSEMMNDFELDPKEGMKELAVKYPALFIFMEFMNAFFVAALVEEMVKHFGYRMVVTPDLLPWGSTAPSSNGGEAPPAKSARSTGAGITVAMVSVALGFACCENLMYIFVYSPPTLGVQVSTLLARSLFPVHPLCAAIQSIGVCKRDLEGNKRFGLGRIIFPAILLHGSFDFVLMVSAYFDKRKSIIESNDDDGNGQSSPEDGAEDQDLASQLPALIASLVFVITGYGYYVTQSRAQNRRLISMDNEARDQSSPLV